MKRIALILVFLLAVSSISPAVASGTVDFSGLSLDALIMLKTWINEEIAERTKDEKKVCVPVGEYIIGADIPAGTYTVINEDSLVAQVSVYSGTGQLVTIYSMKENESIGKITLQTGQNIRITYGPVYFSSYKGLGF